jgi:hypothetical protein
MERGYLTNKIFKLLFTFYIDKLVGCSIPWVRNNQPAQNTSNYIINTIVKFSHELEVDLE